MSDSYVEETERIIEEAAQWAADTVTEVTEALLQGGRPFDTVELTQEEQIEEYLQLRGNPQAWTAHVSELLDKIVGRLQESAVSPDKIAAVHPAEIAFSVAADYSLRMEKILGRQRDKSY